MCCSKTNKGTEAMPRHFDTAACKGFAQRVLFRQSRRLQSAASGGQTGPPQNRLPGLNFTRATKQKHDLRPFNRQVRSVPNLFVISTLVKRAPPFVFGLHVWTSSFWPNAACGSTRPDRGPLSFDTSRYAKESHAAFTFHVDTSSGHT